MILGSEFFLATLSEKLFFFLIYCPFFDYIDCIGLSFPLIIFIILGKRVNFLQKNMVILFYFIFFTLSTTSTISYHLQLSNHVIYNLIPILLVVPLCFFFKSHLVSAFWKILLYTIGILIFVYYLVSLKKILNSLNLFYYLFFAFYCMLGSVIYLIEELNFKRNRSSKLSIEFWFIVCLFFYASNCLLVWSLYDWLLYSLNEPSYVTFLWSTLHNSTLFIHCVIFSIALIWNRHRI